MSDSTDSSTPSGPIGRLLDMPNMTSFKMPGLGHPEGGILIVGAGSLATATVLALAQVHASSGTVHILARDSQRVDELCAIGTTVSVARGFPRRFLPAEWRNGSPKVAIGSSLHTIRPHVILILAGQHTPGTLWGARSKWSQLIADAGLGVTLPLQLALGLLVAEAAATESPDAVLINACFPDAANALLAWTTPNLVLGVGNVMTVEASVRSSLGLPTDSSLQLIGTHAGLQSDRAPIALWVNGERRELDALSLTHRGIAPQEQRPIVAASLVSVVSAVYGQHLSISMPGPMGMLGGYPVRIADGTVELQLPDGADLSFSVELNSIGLAADGIKSVHNDKVVFTPHLSEALAAEPETAPIAEGFATSELEHAISAVVSLRSRLRSLAV